MRDEIVTYYERELTYLRQLAAGFAEKYPKLAGRLLLEPDRCEDPHVERLLQGVAFLTARIRHKLDDDLPEVTNALLGILYPHYLAPVPSMSTVQFHLDPSHGQLTEAHVIPRHTILTTRPVKGVRCRFRTCYPVTLWPLELAEAALETPPSAAPLGGARDFRARAMIRLRLRALAGTTLAALRPPALRFFLQGEAGLTGGLYGMLLGGPCQVEIHPGRGGGARQPVVLRRDAVQPAGFARDEMALPYPRHSFRGYALLQEYFAYPQKFLYLDLTGLERLAETGATDEAEIRIFCAGIPTFDQAVQTSTFRLGCTPIVNLFERPAEPIWLDHAKESYLVVSDAHAPWAHEVYSVDSVVSVGEDAGETRAFSPFYAVRHGTDADAVPAFWHVTRETALDGATDTYLSLVDGRLSPASPAVETLSLRVTCTNRQLPAELPFSGKLSMPGKTEDFDSEHLAPFVRIQCLGKPTVPLRRDPGRGSHWRLISHLSLNYLSLVDHDADALQGILELYDFADSAVTRRQIAGIRSVRTTRAVRNVGGAFCRGLRVTVEFDPEHYVGTGVYPLASVLEAFLGLYASINSFTQLVTRVQGSEEPLKTWPPRAGEQILL